MSVLRQVRAQVERALNELRPSFVPKAQLTFIMRLPGNDDADMIITNDDLNELAKVIERMRGIEGD